MLRNLHNFNFGQNIPILYAPNLSRTALFGKNKFYEFCIMPIQNSDRIALNATLRHPKATSSHNRLKQFRKVVNAKMRFNVSIVSSKVQENIIRLESDGFVMLKGLFSEADAAKAHDELLVHYSQDHKDREKHKAQEAYWAGPNGTSVLTKPSHLLIDAYSKSPTLDRLFERFLTGYETQPLIEALAGKNIKLRGYNIRLMTGAYDPPPSHEWHRDSLGEFGFGILLTDIEPDENAATSFVPGSHLFPYCPRWNNLFYIPKTVLPFLVKFSFFNKWLGQKALKRSTGAFGKKGDAYIFINDTWHGRQPNLHRKKSMVVLIGAFPTEYEFPDKVTPPPETILAQLPDAVRDVANCQLPPNPATDTILKRMIRHRQKTGNLTLWRAAQIERKVFDWISIPLMSPVFRKNVYKYKYYLTRLFQKAGVKI